jgi:hypothetical protein
MAQARGDLATAETQAKTACQLYSMFPPLQSETTALYARILHRQGRDAEALKVCEDTMQQLRALDIEPLGLIALYVELAKSRERLGQHDAAREATRQALPILKRRVEDIPDAGMRVTYLREVPENAQLLELAATWGLDSNDLSQTAATNSPATTSD